MTQEFKKLHLIFATDAKYLKWVSMPIASAYYWASIPSRIVVHVLTSEVNEEQWHTWHSMMLSHSPKGVQIVQHDVPTESLMRFKRWHGSLAPYYRLLAPEILHDLDWCVYADGDTLFLDDPLKLIDLYDSRYALLAHKDRAGFNTELQKWYKTNNLPFDAGAYFCSGFLLMNLKMLRKGHYIEKFIDFIHNHSDCALPDQDALNVVCFGKVKLLPVEWGVFICDAFTIGRPSLIHYVYIVPWKMLSLFLHDYNDGYRLWFFYAKRFFGKSWREIVVDRPNVIRYFKMRLLGFALSIVRSPLPEDCSHIPVIGRYLYRHYASRTIWLSLIKK